MRQFTWLTILSLVFCFSESELLAQKAKRGDAGTISMSGNDQNASIDTMLYGMMQFRNIGPFRGGRASAVAGVPGERNHFYMGTAGGGVWRTTDGGRHWNPISDEYFGGTVGGLEVAPSDANVVYAGGGEQTLRGNVSYGYGVWKSVDAGKSWTNVGLNESRHIGRIRIHPSNPDIVFVAAMGDLFKPSQQRGVYRSTNGGQSWDRVLFANEDAGAVDIAFDPFNPRVMYASTWRARRTPYDFSSGGDGSALWKSTDGGQSWTSLTSTKEASGFADAQAGKGLPTGTLGIIGVAPSPAQRDRVWAIIEHKTEGGVYRSDDGGNTWQKLNDERKLRQRAWYYSRIYAHPTDPDGVYVLNVSYHKSKDGGKTFEDFDSPHSDHHDLWINPLNPDIMAIADDGGVQVSNDGGDNWTTYYNQPTAQFYRVTTDNATPFRIYAAQQDNSTVRIKSRTDGYSIGMRDWEPTAGCECGHIAVNPQNPDIVYGGCYDGLLERVDHKTGLQRTVSVYPDNPMGHGAEGMKFRFQWNFPIFFSPHDPNKLYTASQHLHASTNEGQTWQTISPDLTRNDSIRMVSSGGPITQDNTSVEYYCTIFAAGESPRVKDLLWTGSDDGLVHVSTDGGKNWKNVTPPQLPEWTMINSLEVDPHNDGGCYIAGTRYKLGDYTPYLFHTTDYGATWKRIDAGIPRDHFTRVIRVDANTPNLLFAGTESGLYISFTGGKSWSAFRQNMPVVPITDLTIKDETLIVATQGRSLWVMDDIGVLSSLATGKTGPSLGVFSRGKQKNAVLHRVSDTYLMAGGQSKNAASYAEGTNRPGGVIVRYVLPDSLSKKDTVNIDFSTTEGQIIRSFSTFPEKDSKVEKLTVRSGSNELVWNMREADAERFEGMILWWADMRGPRVPAGNYKVSLSLKPVKRPSVTGQGELSVNFKLAVDPRVEGGESALAERYAFHKQVIDKVSEAHKAIKEMRTLRQQVNSYIEKIDTANTSMKALLSLGKSMDSTITKIEKELYQTQNRSGQDPLNFPIRLTNKLASLNSMTQGEYKPTDAAYEVQREISQRIDAELKQYYDLRESQVGEFNRLVRALEIPAIKLD